MTNRLAYLVLACALAGCGDDSTTNRPPADASLPDTPPPPPDAGPICTPPCGTNQTCLPSGICACEPPFLTCGPDCIDPSTDENNCGGCVASGNGEVCLIGVECISGVCQPCAAPSVVCGNECADLTTNQNHCGACGNACVPGAVCGPIPGGGVGCSCPDPGDVGCQSGCTSLADDPLNCGSCGNNCGAGSSCISGTCVCPALGETHCPGDGCVDLMTNLDHCGSCGNNCVDGLETCGGTDCVCAPTTVSCPGIGGGGTNCVDILSDPRNCGTTCGAADGNNCNSDEYCSGGSCVCRPELDDCGGACTSTDSDIFNCGTCGSMCVGMPLCEDGACVAACSPGRMTCGASETCIDLDSDPRNCGTCGNACAEDEVCVNGNCEDYRSTGPCTTCPCDRCNEAFGGGGSTCCPYGPGEPICVDAPSCPAL